MICAVKGCIALAKAGSRYCVLHQWRAKIDRVLGAAAGDVE